ncbi:MAG TPA: flagellar basal-body MS-ring/collar protein FliF [Terriglobia bacterium]|nr:flagellar basal-body MS-ring/collar protein FliF [Terriglobia bacterium]
MNPSTIGQNIKAFLARYSLQQKLAMVFAAGLVIVLTWGMVYFVNKVEYQVLYSDVDPAEAQSIVTKLQGMQVPYELSQDGRTIRVSSDKLSEVRIQLASEGLPESGRVGFEIFDRTNFGVTNFQEQVNYQRALEGELSRSILTLNEVAAARVHLVMAKESLYERSDDQTKASVILKLKNGRTLPDSSVQGIVNLVASAVKGLSPEKVAVIDYRGKMLSRTDAENSLTGQQLETRQKTESEMAAKIVQILEPGVGAGKVKPQVSVTMNFQQVEETQENYDPKGAVVVSSQKQTDTTGAYLPVGGIVGVRPPQVAAATASPAPPPPTPTPGTQTGRESELINYEVSKSVRHIVNPVGKVDRMSVAVVVDNQTESTTGADGKIAVKSTPRTPEEIKKYHDLVAAAIGFNPDRGDVLIVENMTFGNDSGAETVAEPSFLERQGPSLMTGLRYLIIPVAFFLIYFMFIRPVQKSVMAGWIPVTADGQSTRGLLRGGVQTPLTVKQLEARLASAGGASSNDSFDNNMEQELLPLPQGNSRIEQIRKRVVEQTKQDPENVARLVRVWLNEEKNR